MRPVLAQGVSVKWFRMDEVENAIDYLEMVAHFLTSITDEIKWKWAVIAIHQALYGFAVCATKGTDSRFSLRDPTNRESRLIGIWTALERTKSEEWMPWSHSVPLTTSDEEEHAIKKIVKEFRNEFEHFRPKAWAIEVSGMPELLKHVLRVIRHLALESNTVTYVDDGLEQRVKTAFAEIENLLGQEASV